MMSSSGPLFVTRDIDSSGLGVALRAVVVVLRSVLKLPGAAVVIVLGAWDDPLGAY